MFLGQSCRKAHAARGRITINSVSHLMTTTRRRKRRRTSTRRIKRRRARRIRRRGKKRRTTTTTAPQHDSEKEQTRREKEKQYVVKDISMRQHYEAIPLPLQMSPTRARGREKVTTYTRKTRSGSPSMYPKSWSSS